MNRFQELRSAAGYADDAGGRTAALDRVADAARVSRYTVWAMDTNPTAANPRLATLRSVARVLGTTVGQLEEALR